MKQIYTVAWSRALGGDDMPVDAFCGIAGAFTKYKKACECLEHEKVKLLDELRTDLTDPDDRAVFENSLIISGSIDEGYYEITYDTVDDNRVQWYFTAQETILED